MSAEEIRDGLRGLFAQYGCPIALRVDNGGPWGKPQNTPSWLALWIAGLGITMYWIRPRTPKDNPQIERSNQLIDAWVEPAACASLIELTTKLNWMVDVQRNQYPQANRQSRTSNHPQFYTIVRPYQLATEAQHWQLPRAKSLLAQFRWQRRVSQKGQVTVMSQRFSVGARYRGEKVEIHYDPSKNTYVVHAADHNLICEMPAQDINSETIMSLASTHRQRKRQTHGGKT